MANEVKMPQMGYDMTEGRIAQWLKKVGDQVKKGDAIAEVETDKVTIEIESFFSGTLLQLLANEGDTIPVGQPIALVGEAGEAVVAPPAAQPAKAAEPKQEAPAPAPAQPSIKAQELPVEAAIQQERKQPAQPSASKEEELQKSLAALRARGQQSAVQPHGTNGHAQPQPMRNGDRIIATPVARRVASEQGVDLRALQGSGPDGRIVLADVKNAAARGASPAGQAVAQGASQPVAAPPQPGAPSAPAPATGQSRPLSRMRKAIARRMVESKQQIPHFYVTSAIEMDALLALRKQLNAGLSKEESVSVTDLIIKAAALALAKYPDLFATFAGESINYNEQVHISVAVAVEDGLLAPVIRDCANRSIGAISRDLRGAVERARGGKTKPEELEGGNFTVSNLGMYDVESFIAIVTLPQASALAVGSTRQEPVVRNGELAIANIMRATISVDHRVSDGAYAAQYMQELKSILESPTRLML